MTRHQKLPGLVWAGARLSGWTCWPLVNNLSRFCVGLWHAFVFQDCPEITVECCFCTSSRPLLMCPVP